MRPFSALKENSLATALSREWPLIAWYSAIICRKYDQLRVANMALKVLSSVPILPSPAITYRWDRMVNETEVDHHMTNIITVPARNKRCASLFAFW